MSSDSPESGFTRDEQLLLGWLTGNLTNRKLGQPIQFDFTAVPGGDGVRIEFQNIDHEPMTLSTERWRALGEEADHLSDLRIEEQGKGLGQPRGGGQPRG